jgi:hypothetical protein
VKPISFSMLVLSRLWMPEDKTVGWAGALASRIAKLWEPDQIKTWVKTSIKI